MGFLRDASVYLGLREDPRELEYDAPHHVEPVHPMAPISHGATAMVLEEPVEMEPPARSAEITPLHRTPVAQVVNEVEVATVNRITTIHPRTYNDARNIGEAFRDGIPVIMNLTDLDDADAKRLVDFAAGLVFGLQGAIERITNKVFLLSPAHVEITSDEGEPAKSTRGLFNQS
ncbi:Cell division protein SepF [Austwickia sp. TVS 96-490-7B]|uniref:cell division protein SepF n=1 Tax=Austwickia sp. TVS 96-490-7B TaxID=2830843 RepID=UPI001C567A42|nr:cell division protein SepF [Austwickia sp. TVS 96-490-7B]MBW3084397.1 Cell division protein SepF [Austwickia sp. TVS 96-490-7B]